jgi:hypothetical protein
VTGLWGLYDRDGALADERDRHRVGTDAVASDAAPGVGSAKGTLMDSATSAARAALLRRAVWLEAVTVAWNTIEGILAVTAGVLASSVALMGFGVDSFVETASAAVVGWRLYSEVSGHADEAGAELLERAEVERRPTRIQRRIRQPEFKSRSGSYRGDVSLISKAKTNYRAGKSRRRRRLLIELDEQA